MYTTNSRVVIIGIVYTTKRKRDDNKVDKA